MNLPKEQRVCIKDCANLGKRVMAMIDKYKLTEIKKGETE
jgi:hypothetical protein